jgi:hypothetical protein
MARDFIGPKNAKNQGNIRIQRTTAGVIAKAEVIVRIEARAKVEIPAIISRVRETKKPCSTRDTTRWNKKATG